MGVTVNKIIVVQTEHTLKKLCSFQASFGLHYPVGQNLTKKHIFELLFDCWQIGDLFSTFFTHELAVIHFEFWVWDRNPDIQSKSAQNLLGNMLQFFSVIKSEISNKSKKIGLFLNFVFFWPKPPCFTIKLKMISIDQINWMIFFHMILLFLPRNWFFQKSTCFVF